MDNEFKNYKEKQKYFKNLLKEEKFFFISRLPDNVKTTDKGKTREKQKGRTCRKEMN
jgi:hypothetical protein|nr:MAG TPA: hypothetical protein [Caudoviricetes sp.]